MATYSIGRPQEERRNHRCKIYNAYICRAAIITFHELECGPMPNVMVALPNIGGALCSMPQSLAYAHY